jgi:L-arabinose isomerase
LWESFLLHSRLLITRASAYDSRTKTKKNKTKSGATTSLRPRLGVLALTLELYEKLAPQLRRDREDWLKKQVLPLLNQKADVLFELAVFRTDDIGATIASFEAAGVDALLVLLLSYSPSQISLPALQRTRLPIVIWNTQELFAVDRHYGPLELRNNHGVHGTQDLANVLLRAGVRFHYITSHAKDPTGLDELNDFFAAAAAVRRLRSVKIGMLGYPFPGMGDFSMDATHFQATLGCSQTVLTVEDYIKRAAAADAGAVAKLVAEYRGSYDVAKDVTEADLESAARVELALRGMVADHGLSALTYQFLAFGDDERTPTVPFVAASRLMADGIGFGGEGDVIAAVATGFLNCLNPPASFSEIFTIDFAGNSVLMSHMGEVNVAMARRDRKVPLVARPTPITRTRDRQLALVTSFEPGPATFAALAQAPEGKWRLIVSLVTIEDFGPLPALCVPHFKIQPASDVRQFLTAYANAGGPHHNMVCFGDARRRLRLAAGFMGAEYVEI